MAQFRLEDGELKPLSPGAVNAPAGSGPRHLIVDGRHVYLLTEFSGEVIRYSRGDNGGLSEEQRTIVVDPDAGLSRSRYGADPMEEHLIWGADLHRGGRFLFRESGELTELSRRPVDAPLAYLGPGAAQQWMDPWWRRTPGRALGRSRTCCSL